MGVASLVAAEDGGYTAGGTGTGTMLDQVRAEYCTSEIYDRGSTWGEDIREVVI
jgi:hypothetical protein